MPTRAPTNSTAAPQVKATQRPEKEDANKLLKKPLEGQDGAKDKSYFPQSGSFEAYCERVRRNVADYMNSQAGKNALFIGKARNALVKAILGVGHAQRPRVNVQQEPGDIPDVQEHDYGESVAKQMSQGASTVYNS